MTTFAGPPVRTPFLDEKGFVSRAWLQYFQAISARLSSSSAITGSRAGNPALASLLTNLATIGTVVDQSTP